MREAFYEESAISVRSDAEAKKYTAMNVFAIIFFVLAGLWAFLSLNAAPASLLEQKGAALAIALIQLIAPFLFLIASGIAFLKLKKRYNVSFDYTFVEDELRVSKVFNGKKRKFLIALKAEQMLKIGYCENDSFERTTANMGKKSVIFCTPNAEPAEGKKFIYILYPASAEKCVYVLECRTMLLEYVVRAAGRNKFETR